MKKYILNYLPFYGVTIFVISNAIAMYYYPGGSIFDNEKIGYDFFRNFLRSVIISSPSKTSSLKSIA